MLDTPLIKKVRIACLIDGFNLYHAIDDCPHFHEYKWLNPVALANAYVAPSRESLVATFFFTAVPKWSDSKRAKHERLLAIYEDLGVIVKRGEFQPTSGNCSKCGENYPTFEEKQTDINIALEIQRMGDDDIADKVLLVTGDNDQVSSVVTFRNNHPAREIIAILPPYRKAKELAGKANGSCALSIIQLKKSVLPSPYKFSRTKRQDVFKPDAWVNGPAPIAGAGWQPRDTWVKKHH